MPNIIYYCNYKVIIDCDYYSNAFNCNYTTFYTKVMTNKNYCYYRLWLLHVYVSSVYWCLLCVYIKYRMCVTENYYGV